MGGHDHFSLRRCIRNHVNVVEGEKSSSDGSNKRRTATRRSCFCEPSWLLPLPISVAAVHEVGPLLESNLPFPLSMVPFLLLILLSSRNVQWAAECAKASP